MHKEPLISVIITINTPNFKTCLDTVLLQTYKNLEIICINKSKDEAAVNLLNEYARKDNRISIYGNVNEEEINIKNKGIELAKGEYISFINSDDWVMLDLYEVFVKMISSEEPDIYMFNASWYSKDIPDVPYYSLYELEDILNNEDDSTIHTYKDICNFLIKNILVVNKIYRKQFLQKKQLSFIDGKCYSDYLFNAKTLVNADKIIINQETYYRCQQNFVAEGLQTEHVLDIFEINSAIQKFLQEKKIFTEHLLDFFKFIYNSCFVYYRFCPQVLKFYYYDTMKKYFLIYYNSMPKQYKKMITDTDGVKVVLKSTFDEFDAIYSIRLR